MGKVKDSERGSISICSRLYPRLSAYLLPIICSGADERRVRKRLLHLSAWRHIYYVTGRLYPVII